MIDQNPSYTQQNIDSARSAFGDNPSAVAAGVAKTMTQSPTFQAPIQAQGNAIDALGEIKAYDQKLSGQVTSANQAEQQAIQQRGVQLAQQGSLGATPQETIAKAQAPLPATVIRQPTQGLLSPFNAERLVSGQSKAATDTFDIAANTRAALTAAVGSEAEAYSRAIQYGNEKKALEAELERQRKQDQEKRDELAFNQAVTMAKLTGSSSIVDPRTGQTIDISQPGDDGDTGILKKLSSNGKTFLDEVIDGQGSFADVINQNPQLNESEILELARTNVNKFGQFKESSEELRALGLGIIADNGLNVGGGGANSEIQSYVDLVKNRELTVSSVPDDMRGDVVIALQASGGIEQVDEKQVASQTDFDSISRELDNLLGMAKKQNLLGVFSPKQKGEYENLRKAMAQAIGNIMEGGKLSDKDYEKYLDLLPTRYGWSSKKEGQIESLKKAVALKLRTGADSGAEEQSLRDAGYTEQEIKEYMEN